MSEKIAKKRVLVCGATGFIGRNIVERLAQDKRCDVYGVHFRSRSLFLPSMAGMIQADLTKEDCVEELFEIIKPDIVIQAAAATTGVKDTFKKPYFHVVDNVRMNALLFRAAHEHRVDLLVFFSCSVMYDQTKDVPLKESDFDPSKEMYSPYFGGAWTKVYHEKMCEFYSRLGQTRFLVIRHSNIYGPHDKFDLDRSHVFGATVTKVMMTQEGGEIVVWGDGSEKRDLLYVDDLVDFIELALVKGNIPFMLVNVGCGKTISVRDLVGEIIYCSEKKLSVGYDSSKPQVKTSLCLDCSKAWERFGWRSKTPLREGIRRTMEWWKKNVEIGK